MDVLDYILDGLEAELALERELGIKSVEIDRALLAPQVSETATPVGATRRGETRAERSGGERRPNMAREGASPPPRQVATAPRAVRPSGDQAVLPLVFLHHGPLSAAGADMMAKIQAAMGPTAARAPIVVAPPVPPAKIIVILGGRAMKQFFPAMKGEPGQWRKTSTGADVLITNSPDYILRFDAVTPAVRKIKQAMWLSLKAVVQRLQSDRLA